MIIWISIKKLNIEKFKHQDLLTEASVYSAIFNLDDSSRRLLLKHFKLDEIYQLVANEKDIARCIENYSIVETFYIEIMNSLLKLRTEAIKGLSVNSEENAVSTMETLYDGLSDVYRKEFCRRMVERGDFFQDAYKEIANLKQKQLNIGEYIRHKYERIRDVEL